jgi:hypothetical protein
MFESFRNLARKLRYGEPVYVVSGLPRSGTSMLMNMLVAGGIAAVSDAGREADEDNPLGYFEHERIKDLEQEADKSWLHESRGCAIKVISHLLCELPEDNFYSVIFARRDLNEVISSQNIMLERRGEANPVSDTKAIDHYRKHAVGIRVLARRSPNMRMIEVNYADTVKNPRETALRISQFLGRPLDLDRMAGVVDGRLYRNRAD